MELNKVKSRCAYLALLLAASLYPLVFALIIFSWGEEVNHALDTQEFYRSTLSLCSISLFLSFVAVPFENMPAQKTLKSIQVLVWFLFIGSHIRHLSKTQTLLNFEVSSKLETGAQQRVAENLLFLYSECCGPKADSLETFLCKEEGSSTYPCVADGDAFLQQLNTFDGPGSAICRSLAGIEGRITDEEDYGNILQSCDDGPIGFTDDALKFFRRQLLINPSLTMLIGTIVLFCISRDLYVTVTKTPTKDTECKEILHYTNELLV